MEKIINESLKTKIAGSYDVIVCGGGPAGTAAAIAASRAGTSTLLIESMNCLGGMWTSGFVNPLFDYENKTGIMKEIVDTLKAKNQWGGFWNMSFNYEYMKAILEEMCLDASVTLLYNTRFADVIKEDNTVKGVITENIDGRKAYMGKIVIDATGDACAAVKAGAKYHVGRESDGSCQAITLMFLLGNIPESFESGRMIFAELNEAYVKSGMPEKIPFQVPYLIVIPNTRFAVLQLTHMRGYNPLSAADVTAAVMEGRRQVIEVFEGLKKHVAAFREVELITDAPMLGIRESRRIVGEYTLTVADLKAGAQFDDGIATATFGIDIHDSEGNGQTVGRNVLPYQIPYRCLIPKDVNNLLVAGRCISGTHEAMASYRVTGNCAAMGEAAGCAAYEAIIQKKDLREVGIGEIRRHIK